MERKRLVTSYHKLPREVKAYYHAALANADTSSLVWVNHPEGSYYAVVLDMETISYLVRVSNHTLTKQGKEEMASVFDKYVDPDGDFEEFNKGYSA